MRRKSNATSTNLLRGTVEEFRLSAIRGLSIASSATLGTTSAIASRIVSFSKGMFKTFLECLGRLQSSKLRYSILGIVGSKSDNFTNQFSEKSSQLPLHFPHWKFVDGSIRTQVSLKHSIIARKEEFSTQLREGSGFMFITPKENVEHLARFGGNEPLVRTKTDRPSSEPTTLDWSFL